MQMLVSSVQPNTMRSAVFCSFIAYVVDAIGDYIVGAHSSVDLVTALYVESNVPMCLQYLAEKRTREVYGYNYGYGYSLK